ncbi:NAD(P)H-binding protein [Gordonia insulae]|uniref:3 beta-hydroxysteroid dehydrogenase/Delta 5-->4-isomerase n=1 Tax=Gordonia insulae TaxID=2420509 RepID=A0A3G8JHF4_9ACTN|nr:NAD(P)H-binding protein [Gordonia insulae]AZG44516.1 3 beta-hydroxysteroid dehydrogenase/Delta 5-->4-isomerase [Gordonia insulae]
MNDSLHCLVTGATGYVGGRLAPRLLARGHHVRALARNPSKLADAPWVADDRADVVRGDLSDRDSLDDAFVGIDVVYHLVHSMSTDADFAEEERRSARNVAAAATSAGVSRIVYLGGLHPEGTDLSEHLASRAEVGQILIDSQIETVALQAGTLIGSGSASFELIRHLTERLPAMTTPRWVHNKIQPIAVADALYYLVEAATADVPESRTWDIGGPDVLEYGDMMQGYAEVAGLPRRQMVVVPFLTPTIASRWVRFVTPIRGKVARPLIESLECDAVCRDHAIDDVISPPPGGLLSYPEALAATMDRVQRGDSTVPWTNAAADVSAAQPLPTDPPWSGEAVFVTVTSSEVHESPDDAWDRLSHRLGPEWTVVDSVPSTHLRLRADSGRPGSAFVDHRLDAQTSGPPPVTRITTTSSFFPRGLGGLLYWRLGTPLRRLGVRPVDPFR